MMDCKKALNEAAGDMDAALDWLRTKGLAAAQKKSSRTAAEGLVGVATSGTVGAAVEVNSETDFVAKNDQFQAFVKDVTAIALKTSDDVEALKNEAMPQGGTVAEVLTNNVATIGENQSLRRAKRLEVSKGAVVSYVHNQQAPGLGKIGVLVALESDAADDVLQALGRQLAMHIAAAFPKALNEEDLDEAEIERERAIATEKAAESGKPADIIAKMVEGDRQVPQGARAGQPAVRDRRQDQDQRRRGEGRQGRRCRDQAGGLCPLPAGRGHREGSVGLRGRSGRRIGRSAEGVMPRAVP